QTASVKAAGECNRIVVPHKTGVVPPHSPSPARGRASAGRAGLPKAPLRPIGRTPRADWNPLEGGLLPPDSPGGATREDLLLCRCLIGLETCPTRSFSWPNLDPVGAHPVYLHADLIE